jgi:hypothetical protein
MFDQIYLEEFLSLEAAAASGCKSRNSCLCYFVFCCQGSSCSVAPPSEVSDEILGGSYDGLGVMDVMHNPAKESYRHHFPTNDVIIILFITGHFEIWLGFLTLGHCSH